MADISEIINVQLLEGGSAAAPDNMNVTAIITGQQGVLSSAERYRIYRTAAGVAADWGASSQVAAFANTYFGTSPNPISAGGVLVIGYWRASDEDVAASPATLVSEQTTAATLIPVINQVTDGSWTLTVDGGTEQVVSGADFSAASTLEDVLAVINANITDATATLDNGYFTITSDTTGATSTLTYFGQSGAGTDVSALLGLDAESGAVLTQGAAASTLTAESKLEGIAAIKAAVNIKGACFIDQILDADVPGIASWAQANSVLVYETFSGSDYLVKDNSNPAYVVTLSNQTNFRCLYSKSGNRKLSATYMSRAHVVNFNAQNSAMTMNLKELEVPAEDYSSTEISQAKAVGLDIYTTTKNVGEVLCSPANDFVDNRYNLIAFIDQIQTGQFNLLHGTATKVPQTQEGVDAIEDQGEQDCELFVTAGVFASGEWTASDFFGDREQFLTAIRQKGYYVLARDLADQTVAARENREAPVLQIAVKNAGAIHSENVIINFNR